MKTDNSSMTQNERQMLSVKPFNAPEAGTILEGVVSGITSYRAFISLPGSMSGMVHISEISETYVRDIKDYLTIGDSVKVMVLSAEPSGKLNLSIKRTSTAAPPPSAPAAVSRREQPANFEDRLNRFMRESEERLLDVKRNREHHGSGSRRQ